MRSTALVAMLLIAAWPAAAEELAVAEAYPLRGAETTITVLDDGRPVAGAVVEALYRPNSQTSHAETLPPTGAAGTVGWVPRDAGIVTLTARAGGAGAAAEPIAKRDVAVRYGGFPGRGILIMCLAGLLLFGGAIFGFVTLLRAPPEPAISEPPST